MRRRWASKKEKEREREGERVFKGVSCTRLRRQGTNAFLGSIFVRKGILPTWWLVRARGMGREREKGFVRRMPKSPLHFFTIDRGQAAFQILRSPKCLSSPLSQYLVHARGDKCVPPPLLSPFLICWRYLSFKSPDPPPPRNQHNQNQPFLLVWPPGPTAASLRRVAPLSRRNGPTTKEIPISLSPSYTHSNLHPSDQIHRWR